MRAKSLRLLLVFGCASCLVWTEHSTAQDPAHWWEKPAGEYLPKEKTWKVIDGPNLGRQGGKWLINFSLQNQTDKTVVITPSDVRLMCAGWLSNSGADKHQVPNWFNAFLSGSTGLSASGGLMSTTGDVIAAADEARRCRMRVTLDLTQAEESSPPPHVAKVLLVANNKDSSAIFNSAELVFAGTGPQHGTDLSKARRTSLSASTQPISPTGDAQTSPEAVIRYTTPPGQVLRVQMGFEHQHFIYGDYEPLYGSYRVVLFLKEAAFDRELKMEPDGCIAQPNFKWPPIPEDRRDDRYFVSAPDSLHLEAHVAGNQYFRFPEKPVRYSTKMKLSFWYLVAPGTEGECKARIAQYKDTPAAWRSLSDGAWEECLTAVGRWVKFKHVFRTQPDATTLALDFRICGGDIGEMWIDDVSLEPVGAGPTGP